MERVSFCALAVLLCFSCGPSAEERQRLVAEENERIASEIEKALKVAVMPTLDCLPLFLSEDMGLYDAVGLDAMLLMHTAQMDCDTTLINGRAEGAVTDVMRLKRLSERGEVELESVGFTNSYWLLLTGRKTRISKMSQLADKILAMTRFSATDHLTDLVLSREKKAPRVFKVQVNDVGLRLSMLLGGETDAAWLPEPQATMAQIGRSVVIKDSRDYDKNLGIVAFRKDVMSDERRQEQINKLVECYNMACDSINKNGLSTYSDIIMKYYDITLETIDSIPEQHFAHLSSK